MKKLIALLTIAGMLTFGVSSIVVAQDTEAAAETEMTIDSTVAEADSTVVEEVPAMEESTLEAAAADERGFQQVIKEQFIAGDWRFMGLVLLTLVFGLALSIERIIYLNFATTNNQKLLNKIESAMETGGIDAIG